MVLAPSVYSQSTRPISRGSEIVFKRTDLRVIDSKNYIKLENLCFNGDSHSCLLAGGAKIMGKKTKRNYKRAKILFLYGCDLNDALCCNNLGGMNELGLGSAPDLSTALKFYELSCKINKNSFGCANSIITKENLRILEKVN